MLLAFSFKAQLAIAQINELDSLNENTEQIDSIAVKKAKIITDSLAFIKNEKILQEFNKQSARNKLINDSINKANFAKAYYEKLERDKRLKGFDSTIYIYKGNVYKSRSGWITGGSGAIWNINRFKLNNPIINIGLVLNIKKAYIRANYGNYKIPATPFQNQFISLSIGELFNKNKTAQSFFVGFSYSFLNQAQNDSNNTYKKISAFGLYSEYAFFYKPFYDIGIGPVVFANLDFVQPIIGIRFDIYFANSFKKKTTAL